MANDETPVLAAIVMDRSNPVGNSEDTFSRRSLHVKIGNKTNEPIPVNVSTNAPGFETLSAGMPNQISVTTSSTTLIAANSNRLFAWVSNNSAQTIYVQLGAAAILSNGLRLCPGAKLFLSGSDLWLGDVFGITSTGAVLIDVTEMTM